MLGDATAAYLRFTGGQELEVMTDQVSIGEVVMTGVPPCHFTTCNILLWICLKDQCRSKMHTFCL